MSQPTNTVANAASSDNGRRWCVAMIAMFLLCVVGVVINVESTEVYMNLRIAPDNYVSSCNISEKVNCEDVEKSEWAVLFGVPTALWAVVGYFVIGGLALVGLFTRRRRERGFLLLLSGFCVATGLFLVYLMAFEIGSWCTLCLATDAVNVGLLVMVLFACRTDGLSPLRAVSDDIRWLLRSPAAMVGHLAFGVIMVGAGFVATTWWVNPPIEAAMLTRAQEMVLTLEGVERDAMTRERLGNPGVNGHGASWAGEAIPSEGCTRAEECSCEDRSEHRRSTKITVMGQDEGHHWIGAPEPSLKIHEFTDYECPHCRRAHMRLRRLLSKYPGQIRLYHRHFPLDADCNRMLGGRIFHKRACELSRVAYCAGEQGRFWEMSDLLFQRQTEIRDDKTPAEDLARRLELDVDRFQCCITAEETRAHLIQEIEEGLVYEIRGTPAYVVDGEVYLGKVPTTVLKVLKEE